VYQCSLNREEEQQMQYHHQEETGGILVHGTMEMTMLSTLTLTGVSFSPTTTAH
jgi:hypothetical protein